MIQFNLLPSVKLEFVKAKRFKRITLIIAGLVGGIAFAAMVLLFVTVQFVQKNYSKNLSVDIQSESSKLEGVDQVNKILTIQNQLGSLTALHDSKPVATRMAGFIQQTTPGTVSIATLKVDFALQTIEISGSADTISSVNKFADTLKFTNYKTADPKFTPKNAFSEVVLADFGKDDKGTSYQLKLKFDPMIFSSAENIALVVPANKITTRSQTERPLFAPLSNSGGQ